MHSVRILVALIGFFFAQTSIAQQITKKESAAIDKILTDASATHKPKKYLFKNVNVLTMTDSVVLRNYTVLIESGIIQKIEKDIDQPDVIQIDGTGKYLMPGLVDMHVHLMNHHQLKNTWILLQLLNGVTTVRDMLGEPDKLVLRDNIKNNKVLAPNLYQAGPIVSGTKDPYGLFMVASTAEEGRTLVIQHKKAGYDFIKVYDGLKKDVFAAIADEAHKQNILVVGHIPGDVSEAIEAGQSSAEHLNGYKTWKQGVVSIIDPQHVSLTANSDLWNCPTLYNFSTEWSIETIEKILNDPSLMGLIPNGVRENWQKRLKDVPKQARETVVKNGPVNLAVMKELTLSLYKSNAKLIAGTDAGSIPFLVPGYALHEELRMLHETGIPIYDVLKMTTVYAAQAMQKESEFGTIEVGKRADLLLLDANPLTSLNNLKLKSGLMIRGIWLSAEDLQKLSTEIKAAFAK